ARHFDSPRAAKARELRRKCGDVPAEWITKPSLVYRLLTGSRTQNHRRHWLRRWRNLPDTAPLEPDRHADMAARKAEPFIEALGIAAGVMGQQLDQPAAPAARFAHRPLHQLLADALAAAMRGDANVLDQTARGALRTQPRQDAELQAADHRPTLAF